MNGQVKQVEFFQDWNQQAISWSSPQFLKGQIQVQTPTELVATDQKPGHI